MGSDNVRGKTFGYFIKLNQKLEVKVKKIFLPLSIELIFEVECLVEVFFDVKNFFKKILVFKKKTSFIQYFVEKLIFF